MDRVPFIIIKNIVRFFIECLLDEIKQSNFIHNLLVVELNEIFQIQRR
jgi:hypothetical protein